MQEMFGSVRRSLVFRPSPETHEDSSSSSSPSPIPNFVEKINSCIRKSRVFSKPSPPPLSPSPPPIRWRKGDLIGCGAFGRVYMGMNLDSGELLAVKQVLLATNSDSKEKAQAHIAELEEEVKLLKNLSHANIVRYLGTVREEENLNIFLEFVPGGSISSLLGKFGPFPEAVIRAYTKQLLLGLEYLHKNGIMHRDIKGANILVDNKGCIKLADFGASKQVAELATISGAKSMKGTPYWMAPEVILETGHSFSADIWSVGCTVIEMATGKPPWSQQFQAVAVLLHIGQTKSHPPIPENLTANAKDFLLKCLQEVPNLRPAASELLQHPFVTGENTESHSLFHSPLLETTKSPSSTHLESLDTSKMSTSPNTTDVCNLGSMQSSSGSGKLYESNYNWKGNSSDDDMCQLDIKDNFTIDVKLNSSLISDDLKSFNPVSEPSDDWECKFGTTPEKSYKEIDFEVETLADKNKDFSFPCGPSLSEDDDELTESKIKAFLDEKALDLKKLQSPLYEEFYNSLNVAASPSYIESTGGELSPKYLNLPPKSRSPSRGPVGNVPTAADALSNGSPGSNGKHAAPSSTCQASDHQASNGSPSPPPNDWKGLLLDGQQEPNSPSPSFSEIQRKWKEELDQELERKREMMRQAGGGGKTASPKDRALNRRTRFASPGS